MKDICGIFVDYFTLFYVQVREELVPDDPVSEIMTPSVSDYRKSAASGDKNTPEEKGEGKLALADDALAHQLMAAAGKVLVQTSC